MTKCPNCGAELPAGAKFCPYCGPITREEKPSVKDSVLNRSTVNQPSVGNIHIGDDKRYCPYCETPISEKNRSIRCRDCGKLFCAACESDFNPDRKPGERPYCCNCFEKHQIESRKNITGEEETEENIPEDNKFVDEISNNPGNLIILGDNALHEGLYEKAIEFYDKVLEIDPKDGHTLEQKAYSLQEIGMFEDAIECYDKALDMEDIDTVFIWRRKATLFEKLGRFEEAIECYDQIQNLYSEFTDYYYSYVNKGSALEELGRFEEALKCYNKLIGLKVNHKRYFINPWFRKAKILGKLGRFEDAIECYDKTLDMEDINTPFIWGEKGKLLEKLGRFEEALEGYEILLDVFPESKDIWYKKGIVLNHLGKKQESNYCFQKAKDLEG